MAVFGRRSARLSFEEFQLVESGVRGGRVGRVKSADTTRPVLGFVILAQGKRGLIITEETNDLKAKET